MAIGRVAGPMLLSELDRQGIDLSFTTNSNKLIELDFTNFRIYVKGGTIGDHVFSINGNLAAGNVVLDSGALITTQQLNQPLTLRANGVANVTVINANVISGRVDSTVIGGLTPSLGTFTYLNANVLGTFALANVSNLTANRIPFTNSSNTYLEDTDLKYFAANNSLIVANLTVTELQTFTTLDAANIILRNSNPTSITFIAANNWIKTSTIFNYFESNNVVRAGNIQLDGPNTNQVLFVDAADSRRIKGTTFLTFDGTSLRANGVTRLGNINLSQNLVTTAVTNQDLTISPDGIGIVSFNNKRVTDLADPTQPSDAATKNYVDGLIVVSTASTRSIFQLDTKVEAADNGSTAANIVFVVDGFENGRIENGFVTWQDIEIFDNYVTSQAGPLNLQPGSGDRIILDTVTSVRLPAGNSAERPVAGFEQTGDFRFNTEFQTVEWYNGTDWKNPLMATVTSQAIVPDGTNAVYTLSQTSTTESVLVNFNGVIQRPSTTYAVAGNLITFTTVPLASDIIEVRFLNGTTAQATNPIVVDSSYANISISATTIDSWYMNEYRAVKYTYTAKSTLGNAYEMGEVKLVHDGITAFFTSSFVSKSGNSMITFSTTNSPIGTMNVRVQGLYADTRIKYHAIYLTDPVT
jgi:hypothetical protein